METYHKINAPYYRHMSGPNKGKLILGKWAVPEFEYLANNVWEWTEKVDGTNIRIGYDLEPHHLNRVEFAGRSDNASIPEPLLDYLKTNFNTTTFLEHGLENITLLGEGYGPKIQGGGKYRDNTSFVLFDVKIGNWWLKREDVNDIAVKLGIDSVPVIGEGTLYEAIDFVSGGRVNVPSVSLDNIRNGPMKSTWGDFTAEGLVIRPKVALFDRRGDRIITKIKVKDFV